MARQDGIRGVMYLRGLLLVLGIMGSFFWYTDYQKFHDPKELTFGTARASMNQSALTSRNVISKSPDDQRQRTTDTQIGSSVGTSKPAASIHDAQELIQHGEPAAAAALLEEILRNEPHNIPALLELAMIQILDLKNMDRGRQLLEQIIKIDPTHRTALNELVNLYSDPLRVDQGLQFFRSQFDFAADASELHYAYGRLLSQTGRTEEALAHFDQAKGLKDIQDQVYVDAAQAAVQSGNYEKAFESYRNAVRIQEEELNRAREQGIDSAAFIEERIFSTKVDWARMLLRTGRVAEARSMIDSIDGHDDDPDIVSLRTEMATNAMPM